MRIAIAGSHGVGKTTLGMHLCEYLKYANPVFHSNLARNLIEEGYPLNMDATEASYVQYITRQLDAERLYKDHTIFVSDRTILDPLAYAHANIDRGIELVSPLFVKMMESIWLLESSEYDLYILVPIEFPMPVDGIRPNDESYRCAVESQIIRLLHKYNINYLRATGRPPERLHQTITAVQRYK